MKSESQIRQGGIKIPDSTIISCAAGAALETKGVAELAGSRRGIRFARIEEGIIIDVFVSVYYGSSIPEVSWNMQKNIKNKVERISGERVAAINVNVQRVKFSQDEEEDF